MRRLYRIGLLAMMAALLLAPAGDGEARACPNCKEAVSLGAGEAANLSSGYNWSVIFMISVPFSLMGTGAFAIHRAAKRGALPEL